MYMSIDELLFNVCGFLLAKTKEFRCFGFWWVEHVISANDDSDDR